MFQNVPLAVTVLPPGPLSMKFIQIFKIKLKIRRKWLPVPRSFEQTKQSNYLAISAHLLRSLLSANYTDENTRGGRSNRRGAHFHLTKKKLEKKIEMKWQSYMTRPVSQVIYDLNFFFFIYSSKYLT